MDSEDTSKIIETENSQTTENLKENAPTTNSFEIKENKESATEEVVETVEVIDVKDNDDPEAASDEQITSVSVTTNKNGDENVVTQTTTTTTTTVTKKANEDGEAVQTNIKETTLDTETIKEPKEVVQKTDTAVVVQSESESEESEQEDDNEKVEKEAKAELKDTEEKEEVKKNEVENDEEGELQLSKLVVEEAETLKVDNVEASEGNLEGGETKKKERSVSLENKVSNTDINNQIENIISDIDISIRAQEKITQLKEQELQLIHKQKELASQIQKQQLLAQKLIAENQRKEQELKEQELQNRYQYRQEYLLKPTQPDSLYEEKESSNVSRTVDLRKIFTPATDAVEILPKNRKLYASSAFYSPTLHPTVEDQVELARRISHSLSDISNQTSKGQSMYVNRKKRSVKWVHEGCGQGDKDEILESQSLCKENAEEILPKELTKLEKMPLKLIMNPHGKMRDYNSLKESINIKTGLLSPENCAELITALQLHKGRGAELFAKRRRKADNWVVDETNAGIHSPSGLSDYQPYKAKPTTSPNLLPAYSDAGKHRVQLNIHQENLIEKYAKPGVQVVKSPWEAALQTGSASSAFVDEYKYGNQTPIVDTASPISFQRDVADYPGSVQPETSTSYDSYKNDHNINPQRELAYKPSVAQGWGGRNVELPRANDLQDIYAFGIRRTNDEIEEQYSCATTNNSKTCLADNKTSRNVDAEMLQRLRKLKDFQKNFLNQQRLALADLAALVIGSPSAKAECIGDVDTISSLPKNMTDDRSVDDNELANVRDLIYSFEQQSLSEYDEEYKKYNLKSNNSLATPAGKFSIVSEKSHLETATDHQGLYVPKEISLASYAPPPASPHGGIEQSSYYPQETPRVSFSKGQPTVGNSCYASSTAAPLGDIEQFSFYPQETSRDGFGKGHPTVGSTLPQASGFPVSTVSSSLFTAAPPKQQLYDPTSYQKIPQSRSLAPPQVNFNPSPLSFDKLSKFQEADQQNARPRYINVSKHNIGVRAAPNTAGIENSSSFYRSPSNEFQAGPNHHNSSINQTQSFNNCARGWKTATNNRQVSYTPKRAPSLASSSLPYSDF